MKPQLTVGTMKSLAAAISFAALTGCALLPAPALACEGVAGADCRTAHELAVREGLFLDDDAEIVSAVVRPTEFVACGQDDVPLFDVAFRLRGRSEPLVITVGEARDGQWTVCTY